jgi:hypothetical protein
MKQSTITPPPHSWTYGRWPEGVYPGDGQRGRHVCRAHRDDLLAEGALTRIGREIVILGGPYTRWLAKQSSRVRDFDVPANRPQHAHKGAGRHRQPEAAAN